jgi:hypothetical protein
MVARRHVRRWLGRSALAASLIASCILAEPSRVLAQSWSEVKCARYSQAWSEVLARRGTRGLSDAFVASHDAFVASGCTTQGRVCPRSDDDFALANTMTVLAMNAGTASTFLPFACPK